MDASRLLRTLAALPALVLLVCAPAAGAAVRSVTIDDPADMQLPEFEPRYHTDLQQLAVSYDEAGTVTVAATFFQPEPQGTFDVHVALAPACGSDPDLDVTMSHSTQYSFLTSGSARLSGYVDSLSFVPTLSDDGRTVTGTFSHPALANLNLRCVLDGSAYGDEYRFDYVPATWFAGYAPLVLNSDTATAYADGYLAARYGAAWTASAHKWLKCPKKAFIHPTGKPAYAACWFDFADGSLYRGGSMSVKLDKKANAFVVADLWTRRYSKSVTRCASRHVRDVTLLQGRYRFPVTNRRLWAQKASCSFLGQVRVGDIDYAAMRRFPARLKRATVWMGGTNTAGFEEAFRYRCQVRSRIRRGLRRYSLACSNEIADSFRYSFTIGRVAKPAKRRRPTAPAPARDCHPSYEGACLDPNASDYDCEGGSGDGPKYTGEVRVVGEDVFDLDRDGDGIACED